MTHDYVLPRAPSPHADESFPGFVMRTANAFRFHDPCRLFRRLKPPPLTFWTLCQQDPASDLGIGMGKLLGLDGQTYRRLSMWTPDDTTLSVLGMPVWLDLIRHTARVVCPLCLQESDHHRASWLVDALPVCARHGVWLHDRCSGASCRRPLAWKGSFAHRCGSRRCRQDLRKASVEHASAEALDGIRSLHRLLQGEGDAPLGMPVGAAIRMTLALGQVSFGFTRGMRPPGFIRREMRRMPEVMDAGWRALDDWPHGFHGLLDRLQARASERSGKHGLRKAFGGLSKSVYGWAKEPWGSPIGVAFAEYVASRTTSGTAPSRLARYAPDAEIRHVHVSVAQAQEAIGISPGMMMSIAGRRDMFVVPPRGMGIPSLLRADAVRCLQEELTDFLLPDEARRLLGVGRKVMAQLEAAGLVRRVPEDGRIMESRPYRRGELEAFVASCVGSGRKMTKAAARAAGLTPITRVAAVSRLVTDVCQALADGRLRSAGAVADARGLMRLRLRMEDVERVLPAGRATLSMEDAAPSARCKYGHLGIWARKGFLRTVESDRRGETGKRIEHSAWDGFRRDFVTGGELGELAGQDGSTWLSRYLRHFGVEPVSGPGVDECRLCLFRRAECTDEVMAEIRRVQRRPQGTPQEKRRRALARAEAVADAVAARWGSRFERSNSRYTDAATGRILHVASGRRPDLTGVFKFNLNSRTLESLRAIWDVWVALVPADLDTFILAPLERVAWRGAETNCAYITLRFDGQGRPLEMAEWAVPFGTAPSRPAASRGAGAAGDVRAPSGPGAGT